MSVVTIIPELSAPLSDLGSFAADPATYLVAHPQGPDPLTTMELRDFDRDDFFRAGISRRMLLHLRDYIEQTVPSGRSWWAEKWLDWLQFVVTATIY